MSAERLEALDTTELPEFLAAKLECTLAMGFAHCVLVLGHWDYPRHQAHMFPGYKLVLSACRYGNAVTAPAASDLVVKVQGSEQNQGVCIFDATDETIVQYSVHKAGENMQLALMHLAKHTQPYGLNTASEHA